jgi:DNA-binding Lrp family transcriptional regulator
VTVPRTTAPSGDDLTAAVLRYLRREPNEERPLDALAEELAMDPEALQLAVERLHRRRFLIAPFVEPGRAGGAKLTAVGLRWLIAHEGGKPRDKPVALQPARKRVRSEDEAARLPRATVYGVRT